MLDAGPEGLLTGVLHVYVAFDIGDEVDLDAGKRYIAAESHRLPRQARTPTSVAYQPAPLRINPGPVPMTLAEIGSVTAAVDLTVFDFAGASVGLHVPFHAPASALSRLAGSLADATSVIQTASETLRPVYDRMLPAIQSPRWSDLTEEYFVIQFLPEASLPAPDRLLADHAGWLAGLIRLDPVQLAASEIEEALRLRLSYAPGDLVIADWAAAVIVDRDCDEVLETIAFANLQLLEFQQIDRRLGKRLNEAYRLIHSLAQTWLPFWRSYTRPLRALGEMKVDANEMMERSSNALKLIGDQYLARLYQMFATRLHLDDWSKSARSSLSVLEGIYRVISDQAATFRAELLEWMIILLIALDILVTLAGR